MSQRTSALCALPVLALLAAPIAAQDATPQSPPIPSPLTIPDAVRLAVDSYPVVQEQRARQRAATANVSVAQTAYLPRLDAVWQENRATHNNVFGQLFPQSVIPSVSGPVLPKSSDSVWGSAAGALLSWEAIDFGLRKAAVDVARAQEAAASARITLTELDAAAAAADAYLTVLAADAGVRAAQANVDRLQVFADAVRTLVTNQLRPGVDQSRADSELAIARNQLIQATQTADLARVALAGTIGRPSAAVEVTVGRLMTLPEPIATPSDVATHPAARAELASVDVVRAREKVLDRSGLPRVILQSAATARGSGATLPGIDETNGLFPRVPNWAAGVSVSFPLMEAVTLKPRREVEAENERAEQAVYRQTLLTLTTQQARAAALYKAAASIAQNMPTVLTAARETELRVRTRYDNALGTVTDVAEAQRLLAQAEADEAVARLAVWRAVLAQAQAAGDLTPFLTQLRIP